MDAHSHTDDRFSVAYRDERGREHEAPLSSAARLPFHLYSPIRKFRSRPTQRHLSGYYFFASSGALVAYESGLEMAALMRLDFDGKAAGVLGQPFRLGYLFENPPGNPMRRFHVPDIYVRYRDGESAVVNVKRKKAAGKPDHLRAASAMKEACDSAGWAYSEMYEPEEPYFSNLSFLTAYRRPPLDPRYYEYAAALVDLCAEAPRPIGQLLTEMSPVGEPAVVKPALLHLLWTRVLVAPMEAEPISDYTFVSLPETREPLPRSQQP